MADRYLLESGAPDGYLLEDSSGVLLLEAPDPFTYFDMTNHPAQPKQSNIIKTAVVATFSLVAPAFVSAPGTGVSANSTQVIQQRDIQYQALAFVRNPDAAPAEDVTLDKWYQASPNLRPRSIPVQTHHELRVDVPVFVDWLQDWPYSKIARVVQHSDVITSLFVAPAAPEVITADKWYTDSPAHYFRISIQHVDFILLDIFPEPEPEPPEPPEPEPEPRRVKSISVKVQHLRRPPGGFNTVYYVDDD